MLQLEENCTRKKKQDQQQQMKLNRLQFSKFACYSVDVNISILTYQNV